MSASSTDEYCFVMYLYYILTSSAFSILNSVFRYDDKDLLNYCFMKTLNHDYYEYYILTVFMKNPSNVVKLPRLSGAFCKTLTPVRQEVITNPLRPGSLPISIKNYSDNVWTYPLGML